MRDIQHEGRIDERLKTNFVRDRMASIKSLVLRVRCCHEVPASQVMSYSAQLSGRHVSHVRRHPLLTLDRSIRTAKLRADHWSFCYNVSHRDILKRAI